MIPSDDKLIRMIAAVDVYLDAYAENVRDDDYLPFLAAIGFYLSRCAVDLNDGKEAIDIAKELSHAILENTEILLKKKGET